MDLIKGFSVNKFLDLVRQRIVVPDTNVPLNVPIIQDILPALKITKINLTKLYQDPQGVQVIRTGSSFTMRFPAIEGATDFMVDCSLGDGQGNVDLILAIEIALKLEDYTKEIIDFAEAPWDITMINVVTKSVNVDFKRWDVKGVNVSHVLNTMIGWFDKTIVKAISVNASAAVNVQVKKVEEASKFFIWAVVLFLVLVGFVKML